MQKMLFSLTLAALLAAPFAHAQIEVKNAWVRATTPGAMAAAGYMHLVNNSATDIAIIGASSPAAMMTELHTTTTDASGKMQMLSAEKFIVPANGELHFKPGSHHIMFMGLNGALEADTDVALSLRFDDETTQNLRVPVKSLRYSPAAEK